MSDQDKNAEVTIEETVLIDGVTGETIITITEESAEDQGQDPPSSTASATSTTPAASTASQGTAEDAAPTAAADQDDQNAGADLPTSGPSALSARDEAIYTIRLLTAAAVGAVVEGGDQLVTRLKQYEQQLQEAKTGDDEQTVVDEDEFDRLRYATIGLIFDTQNMIGRSLELTLKATETSLDVANKVTKPFRNFFLFRPITKRVDKRVEGMVDRGQDSLSRWIKIGRQVEPEGRQLATMTYNEIVDEFISTLSENPELQELVAQQSISLAAGMRDEVRERTVTSDNVLEDIARRILRRQPRPELAEPPPEVQRWAGISIDNLKDYEIEQFDEQRSDSTE